MKTPTPPRRFRHRALAVDYIRNRLVRESYPRTQMALIVALTGSFGLLASFTMLHLGVDSMALRYPIALACAYLLFLFLIWLWLHTTPDDYLVDAGFSGGPTGTVSSEAPPAFTSGGEGDFGGGGASGAFDGPTSVTGRSPAPVSAEATEPASKATLSLPDADADELTIPLAVIALSATIAVASVYVVSIAPLLFAEVLVDGALSYALFHRLRREQEQRHWLRSALRRTLLPFLATAVFLAAAGAAMQIHAPGARSIGQVMAH